jgi:heme-degrading monooxygenase HmoA
MIARIWRGRTAAEHLDTYAEYMQKTGIEGLRATPGNRAALILRREVDGEAEFLVFSLWESWEAIRAFAGERPEVAVYYPEDERFLLEMEREVRHFEVPVAEFA